MEKGLTESSWKWPLVLVAVLGLSAGMGSTTVSAHVILSSRSACHWLRRNAVQPSPGTRRIFAQARRLSGTKTSIYLDRSKTIAHVAHIPDAPYLTAIVGREARCVAVSPVWLDPLTTAERLWLTLVGIGGLEHPHTYKMMLHAAENPPFGLFSGLARWWGRRTADRAILASEKQATLWLRKDNPKAAYAALERLQRLPDFATDHWLPKISAQKRAVQQG